MYPQMGLFYDKDQAEFKVPKVKDPQSSAFDPYYLYPEDPMDSTRKRVLKIEYKLLVPDAIGGYFWKLKGFNPLEYPLLILYARGDSRGYPEKLKVEVKVPGEGWFQGYIELTDVWQKYILPFLTFDRVAQWAEDQPIELVIAVEGPSITHKEGSYYIDDLSFANYSFLLQDIADRMREKTSLKETTGLQKQLALISEYLVSARAEAIDLKKKIRSLEEELDSLRKKLKEKEGELKQVSYRKNFYLSTMIGSIVFLILISALFLRVKKGGEVVWGK